MNMDKPAEMGDLIMANLYWNGYSKIMWYNTHIDRTHSIVLWDSDTIYKYIQLILWKH